MILLKDRNFGDVISDSIRFFRENFRTLMRIFLIYALPVVVMATAVLILLPLQAGGTTLRPGDEIIDVFWMFQTPFLIFIGLSFVQNLLMASALVAYFDLYREGEPRPSDGRIFRRMLRFLPRILLFFLFISFLYILIFGLMYIFSMAGVLGIILIMLLTLGVIGSFIFLAPYVALIFVGYPLERKGMFAVIRYVFKLITPHWGFAFGVVFVLYFIAIVATYIVTIPVAIIQFSEMLSNQDPWSDRAMFLQQLQYYLSLIASAYVMTFYLPGIGILFYSLKERQEQGRLRERISRINPPPLPDDNE